MRVAFWLSLAVIFYTYAGYPLLLACLPRRKSQSEGHAPPPSVSIIMAVRNAEAQILQKLENLACLDYPADRLQIIVVSDGSTDRTSTLVRRYKSVRPIELIECAKHGGKAAAINQAVQIASGEILFMVDVRQKVRATALKNLVRHFQDPDIGAVSGELLFVDGDDAGKPIGVGVYWRFEKLVRKLESRSGSVIGVTGAVYAVRRDLVPPLPENLILDDVYIPMHVVKAGKRVLFESDSIVTDRMVSDHHAEFNRKVRTLYGNLQIIELAPWLIAPSNPVWSRFVSHKLLRIAAPVPLLLMLVSSFASHKGPLYTLFWVQVAFYAMAALAPYISGPRFLVRLSSISRTFVLLNAACVVAVLRYAARRPVIWTVTKTETPAGQDEVVHA